MIRILVLFAAFGTLASCAQHREPKANCFAFRASVASGDPGCIFTPLGLPEDGVEV